MISLVTALVIATGGAGAWGYLHAHDNAQDQQSTAPLATSPSPSPTRPRPTGPAPTIPDSSVSDVVTQLSARWHITFTTAGRGASVNFSMPGAPGKWYVGIDHGLGDLSDRIVDMVCRVTNPGDKVNLTLVKHMEECLAPVLRGADKAAVPTWLDTYAVDIPSRIYRDHYFTTFYLDTIQRKGMDFDVYIYPRNGSHPK